MAIKWLNIAIKLLEIVIESHSTSLFTEMPESHHVHCEPWSVIVCQAAREKPELTECHQNYNDFLS